MSNSFNIWSILRMCLLLIVLMHFLDSAAEAGKRRKGRKKSKSKRSQERASQKELDVNGERKSKGRQRRPHKRPHLADESVEKSWSVPTLVQLFEMQQAHEFINQHANPVTDSTKLKHVNPLSSAELMKQFRKEKKEKLENIPASSAPEVPVPPKAKVDFFIHRPKSRHFYPAPTSTVSAITSSVLGLVTVHSASGRFGVHSRSHKVFGRLIHVSDAGRVNSHFGCGSAMANKNEIPSNGEPWVALIARGHCSFFMKIKIAEKYNATAAIIYDHKNGEVPEMFTLGTRIVSLAISKKDGHKMARISDSGTKVMVNIEVDDRIDTTTEDIDRSNVGTTPSGRDVALIVRMQKKDNGGNGAAIFSQSATSIFLFVLLSLLIQRHVIC